MTPSPETCARIRTALDAIDYAALGRIYCEFGGEAFFADRRTAVFDLGRSWAGALAARLAPRGRSLYVGAGIAELPAILTEALELERSVVPTNLRAEECEILNAALDQCAMPSLRWRATDAVHALDEGPFDHVAIVSVLDDPEVFPEVAGVTYGRADPRSLDPGRFAAERLSIRRLSERLMRAVVVPGVVTTTTEEVGWLLDALPDGVRAVADEELVETAIVGDPIGFLRLESS